jgi:hypothetical protein
MKINKNITVQTLFKNYKEAIHLSLIEDSEVELVLECNNASLKKLSSIV